MSFTFNLPDLSGINSEEIAAFGDHFRGFPDADHDGGVELQELIDSMAEKHIDPQLAKIDAPEIISMFDKDGNGALSTREFHTFINDAHKSFMSQ
mmetsp:Transcript_24283/g.65834  ORF Transcript_24283/g.65834 Transcript_24283/m.65834 type:complete len:95 (-) Transcript_24283:544-828(-)